MMSRLSVLGALALVWSMSACEEPDLTLPTDAQVAEYFSATRIISAEMVGNVAEITVGQNPEQLRRGGRLWAQMGPYIYLFSDPTRSLFRDFGGLAGVRVVTRVGRAEVARALLARPTLNDLTWRRALNVAGKARLEGTQRLTLLEDLIDFGEDHTEFTYNARYTRGR
jgi:hypothetical protein